MFDLIVAGRKTLEYRQRKTHWESRLLDANGQVRPFDIIQFRNGYRHDSPIARFKWNGMRVEPDQFVIQIGSPIPSQ